MGTSERRRRDHDCSGQRVRRDLRPTRRRRPRPPCARRVPRRPVGLPALAVALDGAVATVRMDVDEAGGLVPGYELKLNSYDLGVDIELYDIVQRLRFEHPEVRAVVMTSGKDKIFCAGANIRMLAASPHHWKVNFCKFTNETRNGIEDATRELRPDLDRGAERHGVRRRVRAGAGLRAHPARRRPLVVGVAARAAAARRAAGHRRPDPRRRQAARAPRPRRLLRHQGRGPRRAQGRAVAAGGRGGPARRVGRHRRRACGRVRCPLRPPGGRRRACR